MRGADKASMLAACLLSAAGLLAGAGLQGAGRRRSPAAYKEGGIWKTGAPSDAVPRGAWWTLYSDATLNGLESRIETANPNLAAALAHYDTAVGYLQQVQAGQYPALEAGGHADTDKQSVNRPLRSASQPTYYGDDLAGVTLSWDLDLGGRIRSEAAAGAALAEGSFADLAAVRLSLQAQLADAYVSLRGLDAGRRRLLHDTIDIYQQGAGDHQRPP